MRFSIRPATNADGPGIVCVIRAVFEEYGFTWEEDGYHADLYDVEGHYSAHGHTFYVAESEDGAIVGTVALKVFSHVQGAGRAAEDSRGKLRLVGCDCSLDRLYVLPSARRNGIGRALAGRVLMDARGQGRTRMEIWSDKRFEDAHRLYGKLGARAVADRILDDPDQSPEWGLVIDL
ncbi:MAG: GNAT family N-acetyltransferase [Armatimonadetes bacterium]|nr:GNAT family N-acetyltransferase [Armatimonadota bacterium]